MRFDIKLGSCCDTEFATVFELCAAYLNAWWESSGSWEEEGDLCLGGNNVVDNDDLLLMIIMTKKVQTLSTRRLTQKHPSTLAKLSSENIVILIIIEFALTNVLRF